MAKQKFRPPNDTQGHGFRGPQGFPVPMDMKIGFGDEKYGEFDASIDEDSFLEDIVVNVSAKVTNGQLKKKAKAKDVVSKKGSPLDIVVKNVLGGLLGEADEQGPKGPPKGIAHLEDLKPDEFLRFLEKYRDLPLDGGLEVSEKVDGSAQMSFGVRDGQLWTKSKNGTVKMSADEYPDQPMFRALKQAHWALQELTTKLPEGITFVSDVLYTRIPNSIEYGDNRIVVHGISGGDELAAKRIIDQLSRGNLSDGDQNWKIEFKRVLSPDEVMVDVKEEFASIAEIYRELKTLTPDKLKAAGKGPYKAALAKFQAIQLALKKKLVRQLRNKSSAYGPVGGGVEGLVFRDLESGSMTKLVDKEYFTKLNKFLWRYRELLDKGVKVGDQWQFGILQKFRNAIADKVLGSAVAKTPGFVGQLKKFGADLEYPPEADTPDKKADVLLAQYIQKNGLMQGDFLSGFAKELFAVIQEFQGLRKEWDAKKKGELVHDIKDDLGKVIKTIAMDPIIKGRTDEAFKGMEEFLTGTKRALAEVGKMKGDLTKKVALLKLMMGQGRLEKLSMTEKPTTELKEDRVGSITPLVQKNLELLNRHGFAVTGNSIGTGASGTAFNLKNGKVLKVTTDDSEARASNHLKGKKLKHAAQIYDVFKFKDQHRAAGGGPVPTNYYGIAQEKVQPLPEPLKKNLSTALRLSDDLLEFGWMLKSREENETYANQLAQANPDRKKEIARMLQLFDQLKIWDMLAEIKGAGVEWQDLSVGNVMMRGSDLVAIDLGVSHSPGVEPDILESVTILGEGDVGQSDELIKKYAPLLQKRGFVPKSIIGQGSRAVVYDMGDKVFKVTDDQNDAHAALKAKEANLKYVVKIFDVFRFPSVNDVRFSDTNFYGIVAEKLTPIPGSEKAPESTSGEASVLEEAIDESFLFAATRSNFNRSWAETLKTMMGLLKIRLKDVGTLAGQDMQENFNASVETLRKYSIDKMIDELGNAGIQFSDWHTGNIMKKGSTHVLVDLGHSKVHGGREPDMLEKKVLEGVLRALRETRADQVGVTIGRFQPFHKGHAEIIRGLAKKFDKVIVIVAGNTRDKKNPFSLETRMELMQKSLPDVMSKVEIHKAEYGGKGSGYIPGVLSDIVKDKRSSVEADTAIHILVGPDRVGEIQKQLDHAKLAKEQGTELLFDPNLAELNTLPGVKNDDDTDRISGTKVREALVADQKDVVKAMMDPHLVSNPADFEGLYVKMRSELMAGLAGKRPKQPADPEPPGLEEDLKDIGSEAGVQVVLQANADKLLASPWKIDVNKLTPLGSGQEGIAYDIGGGKVLKVTADEKEAETSYGIKGKTNLKHVVHVFDVFRFRDTPGITAPVYGLVTEKLIQLTAPEQKEFDDITEECQAQMGKKRYIDAVWTGDWNHFVQEMRSAFETDIAKESGLPLGHPRLARVLEARMQRYLPVMQKFKMADMMSELKGLGIKFADYHGGNLMKRGGDYVINDLGRSESTSKKVPPMMEDIVSKIIEDFGFGSSAVGLKAGSSAWSASKNRVDPNSKELWQNQLNRMEPFHSGSADIKVQK